MDFADDEQSGVKSMIMLIVMAMMMVDLNYIEQSYIVLEQRQKNLKMFYIT